MNEFKSENGKYLYLIYNSINKLFKATQLMVKKHLIFIMGCFKITNQLKSFSSFLI